MDASEGHERVRSWWGWGWEDQAYPPEHRQAIARVMSERFGRPITAAEPPALEDIQLPQSRGVGNAPDSVARMLTTDRRERAAHAHGRSYRDVVRAFAGQFDAAPDAVAYPGNEADVTALLDWCSDQRLAVIPFGGGSSVVGGVECPAEVAGDYAGVITMDLTRMNAVVEIDAVSRAARIQGGAMGPALEDQLRPHGLTLRHFPQSFEFSTLGGWLATRSGGHYATRLTHIDDLCEAMRVVTPAGVIESRRLPGSGAGPSPDRLFLGSEGSLGVITEAWMRLQSRPRFRASAGVHFASFAQGADAVRALSQSGLDPANCRLLDPGEAAGSAGVTDGAALLVLGFESADHPVDQAMARAMELCQDHGGHAPDGIRIRADDTERAKAPSTSAPGGTTSSGGDAVDAWRNAFIRAPYGRDALVASAMIVETFETAVTWDRFTELHAEVTARVQVALHRVCGAGTLTCRFTHVYPDGPAPYFSVMAPGRRGSEVAMWDEIKAAASEAVLDAGGTITHHHAVGRDHRPWYDRQRPDLFGGALRATKGVLDPAGILNPGAVIDAPPR